jgi:ribonucleoside-diphosphate reductase beta chain
MILEKKKLFNVDGSDEIIDQNIVNGNGTGILNLNNVKYSWTKGFYRVMVGNHWIPEKVSMAKDKITINDLTPEEDVAVQDTLSFLIFLDSLQVNNLPHISDYITDSSVTNLLVIQAFQETIHSQSYQYILESLYPSMQRESIYNRWRDNPLLLERNRFIASQYENFVDNPTHENFKRVLIANLLLEGIYFYSGFNLFDQLASRKKLVQTQKMIDYIRTDEQTHVALFIKIIHEVMDTQQEKEWIYEAVKEAVNQEMKWAVNTYSNNILGISEQSAKDYVKHLGNTRLRALGLEEIFGDIKNPYSHLGKGRENFFESGAVTEYSRSEAVEGWDF